MSIVSVKEIWNGRNGQIDDKGERNYVRAFLVITNSTLTGPVSVRDAVGIPRRFDIYTDPDGTLDTGAVVQRLAVDQTDDPYVWEVKAEYSSKTEQPEFGDEDPLARPADIEWGTAKFTVPLTKANDGTPIKNSAGEPFDPPGEKEEARLTLKITRNEAGYDAAIQLLYFMAVNDDNWFGLWPGQARCVGISASRQYEKNLFFWKVTYEFEIKPATTQAEAQTVWAHKPLDQGYYELVAGERILIRDKYGAALTSPALLNGAGAKLPSGNNPVFITFYVYNNRPFGPLNLP